MLRPYALHHVPWLRGTMAKSARSAFMKMRWAATSEPSALLIHLVWHSALRESLRGKRRRLLNLGVIRGTGAASRVGIMQSTESANLWWFSSTWRHGPL
jgi:hypothetical protein